MEGRGSVRGSKAGLPGTHLWLKGGSRRQSRRRDKLRNFDWLAGGGGLHLGQNHSRLWIQAAAAVTLLHCNAHGGRYHHASPAATPISGRVSVATATLVGLTAPCCYTVASCLLFYSLHSFLLLLHLRGCYSHASSAASPLPGRVSVTTTTPVGLTAPC